MDERIEKNLDNKIAKQKIMKEENSLNTGVEHKWMSLSDRWIYIKSKDGEVVGLNFMQGDDYDLFVKDWCYTNQALTNFYNSQKHLIKVEGLYERIDTIMWLYFEAVSQYEAFLEFRGGRE